MKQLGVKTAKAEITCATKDLFQTLKFLKKALPKNPTKKQFNCEITVKKNEAIFVVIGAKRTLYCKTNGVVKVTIPLLHIYDIARKITDYNVHISFDDGSLKINELTVNAWTFFFHDDTILRSVNLPINFKSADIMRLPEIYTQQEMDFNNLTQIHRKAYETLSNDIKSVHRRLEKYGFTLFEIEKIIRDKVYNDKPKTSEL